MQTIMSPRVVRPDRGACLRELRRRIGLIERGAFGISPAGRLKDPGSRGGPAGLWEPLGAEVIDRLLGADGLAGPALHELVADGYGSQPAVRDFGLALLASLLHRQADALAAPMLWCQRRKDELECGRLYGPGLLAMGLSPERLIMVTGRRDADCLWAMEQGLRSESLAAVIGMVDGADLIASRRLSLAAAEHRTWCLLLPRQHGREPSAASTRWRVRGLPSVSNHEDERLPGRPRWQLDLERARNGRNGRWIVEWDHAAHRFHLAPPMADRPVFSRDGDVATRNGGDFGGGALEHAG